MKQRLIYLDHAAATPMDERVLAAMQPYFRKEFYNPSGISLSAKHVKQALENARKQVAQLVGAKPTEVIFTAGGTEANNLAILGLATTHQNGHIVTSALEHDSVLAPVRHLASMGWRHTEIKPERSGVVSAQTVAAAITDETVIVSVMYANNEVGTIQPIKDIAKAVAVARKQREKTGNKLPLYFHTDAAQAANYLDIHVHRLGIDLMTVNGGKIYGPKQSGMLFVKTGVKLSPIIFGGGQEGGLRSGTENVPFCIGFAEALAIASTMRNEETKRLKDLQQYALNLLKSEVPEVTVNGSLKQRLPNNLHLTVPGADNERLLYGLEEKSVICAAGSACSASKDEASHVLLAMGVPETDIRASLRLSFGRNTKEADIKQFITALKTLSKR